MDQHHTISYQLTREAYEAEIARLAQAINVLIRNKGISNIFSYRKYINKQCRSRAGINLIIENSKGSFIIDLSTKSEIIWSLINTAHIAACTSILKGQKFTEAQFQPATLQQNAINAFPAAEITSQENLDMIAGLLSRLDACRTAQILKIFGLFNKNPKSISQLALGCGSGINDIESIHQSCDVKKVNENATNFLSFDYTTPKPEKITLIDADTIHQDRYEHYIKNDPSVHGIVGDMLPSLDKLTSDNNKKYNLVSVLRMEHRMIPDIIRFFTKLYPLISKDCDFILSIGLGENLADFKARTKLVSDLYNFLNKAKLKPVVFKLHESGTLEHQQISIKFGHPILGTYQILYCKLNPSLIRKHLDTR